MRKPKKREIPHSVFTLLGPVPVELVATVDRNDSMGQAHFGDRTIKVQSGFHEIVVWQTFGHELMHFILSDANADSLSHRKLEAVCDAFGTWVAAAVAAGAITFLTPLSPLSTNRATPILP